MKSKERREREKETMKENIIEATIMLINENGYENVSIRKIADIIEYSPTTIYLYYKDKADIIEDMANRIYDETISNIQNLIFENKDSPSDKLLRLSMSTFIHTFTNEPRISKAILTSNQNIVFEERKEELSTEKNGIIILNDLLEKCRQEQQYTRVKENTALLVLTALIGFVLNSVTNELYTKENYESIINDYIDMLTFGLR